MSILWMIVVGFIIGAVAKLMMPGPDPGGAIITMFVGIAGSMIAGFLGRRMGWYAEGQSAGIVMSIVGAILILAVYRLAIARSGRGDLHKAA